MRNPQRGFIVPFLILIIALVAIGGLYIYIGNKQSLASANLGSVQNASTTLTTVASTTPAQDLQSEDVFTGGGAQPPECASAADSSHRCVLLDVGERCYIPNGIDSPMYMYSEGRGTAALSTSYSFKRGSYVWPVNASGVITKDDYDILFPGNQISSSTIIKEGEDVSMYLRTFQANDNNGGTYLFDAKGKQMASLSDLNKHLIPFSWISQFGTDWDSLETIKRMRDNNPTIFATFPVGPYVPATSSLTRVDIVYECAIENGQVVPKKKIQEIDFFKDLTFTTIQL